MTLERHLINTTGLEKFTLQLLEQAYFNEDKGLDWGTRVLTLLYITTTMVTYLNQLHNEEHSTGTY